MKIIAEVTEDGTLRVKTPGLKPGDQVILETQDNGVLNPNKGKWSDIDKVLAKADALDFPRRTHEEIIRDLHELKG